MSQFLTCPIHIQLISNVTYLYNVTYQELHICWFVTLFKQSLMHRHGTYKDKTQHLQ